MFPDHDDPLFALQLARRAEFEGATYDGTVAPVEQRAEEVCEAPFEIAPNQRFGQALLGPESPLNALFLFNELGTGKTTATQIISEEFRRASKSGGMRRHIYVVANPTVQENFRKQLFDAAQLRFNPGTGKLEMPPGTIADGIWREIGGGNASGIDRQMMEERAKRLIQGAYTFIGYTAFASRVYELAAGRSSNSDFSSLKVSSDGKSRLRARFDNSLLIVDEAHNINQREYGKSSNNAAAMDMVARNCNIKLVMMSATPMFNNHRELVPLVNLLNLVDRRAPIRANQVFDSSGRLLETPPEGSDESGRDLLARKLTGYVSFVRGETPYAFPFRLLPDTFLDMSDPADAAHRLQQYPTRTMNGRPLPADANVQLQMFVTAMPTYQRRAYLALVAKLLSGGGDEEEESSSSSPADDDIIISTSTGSSSSSSGSSSTSEIIDNDATTTTTTTSEEEEEAAAAAADGNDGDLNELPMGATQVKDERQEGYNYSKLRPLMYMCMMVYPSRVFDRHFESGGSVAKLDPTVLRGMSGAVGLKRMMTYEGGGGDNTAMRNFRYRDSDLAPHERVFAPENLGRYSAKIAALVERVRSGTGVVLVYSYYVYASLIPIALALEQAGLMGVEGDGADDPVGRPRPLWHASELTGVVPLMVPAEGDMPAARACYTMVTGQASLSASNADNVRLAVAAANAHGHRVKVVLFTAAGAEGQDYKCARQMHPMEPWFNFSRMEQVVGRAVRNRSHCRLPFAQRNTEVYYHATVLSSSEAEADAAFFAGDARAAALARDMAAEMETVDLYQYRWCEDKDRLMAPLRRLLKQTSVDCVAHRGQQNFTLESMGQSVELELSSRRRTVQYAVGDRPFSSMCDYSGDCRYQCHAPSEALRSAINADGAAAASATKMTYGPRALKRDELRLVRQIQDLYREQAYYRFADLRARLSVQRRVPEWQIYSALQALLRDPALRLVNESGLPGRLVAVRDSSPTGGRQMWYLFQPTHLSDPRASVFERRARAVDQPHVVQFSRAETIAPPAAMNDDAIAPASAAAAAPTEGVLGARPPPTPADANRARLAPRMLAHIFARVVFSAEAGIDSSSGSNDTAVTAAVQQLVPFDWYEEVGRIMREAPPSAVITPDAVAWTVAQYFLDSRPVEERMCMLRDLLQDIGGLPALLQEGGWQQQQQQHMPLPLLGSLPSWSARVRRCMARYFAERVYLPPQEEEADGAVAVMVDMARSAPPVMVAWILTETETMQPRTMQTAVSNGTWLEAAVLMRNGLPTNLEQRVDALRKRGDIDWPVVINCLNEKHAPGAWNAAMTVRVKTLTDTRINYNGGQDLTSKHTDVVRRLWQDARARLAWNDPATAAASEAMTAAGDTVLVTHDRRGRSASSAFVLLMCVAEARGLGDLSSMTGEAYAMSSYAKPPPDAPRRNKRKK